MRNEPLEDSWADQIFVGYKQQPSNLAIMPLALILISVSCEAEFKLFNWWMFASVGSKEKSANAQLCVQHV